MGAERCIRARASTLDTGDVALLGITRSLDGELLVGLFNFSDTSKTAWAIRSSGKYRDLITGEMRDITEITVPAQGFYWLKRIG